MYKRFLNNNDYLSIITQKSLNDITRGDTSRYEQAESDAEMAIIEYLSDNYEIEAELDKGRYIAQHDRKITFPVGAHLYFNGNIYKVIRSISGFKAPCSVEYWKDYYDIGLDVEGLHTYSQFATYYVGDVVKYNGQIYQCCSENGFDFGDIRMPMVSGWRKALCIGYWLPVQYDLWSVVKYNKVYYTLINLEGFDNNVSPYDSDCWGAIADYDNKIDTYDLSSHEFVIYDNEVYYPEMDINADKPEIGVNITPDDPRNPNIKKHLVRLALYELTKLVAPNNVSTVRLSDYESSMKWLSDASKLKINPQISRKIDDESKQPISDWQLATFQTNYDVNKNPWIT